MHYSHTASVVIAIVTLLLIAAGTLALTKRIRLPFTVVLVLVGILLSFLGREFPHAFGVLGELEISPDLIFFIFLPTLVFESTFNLDVQQLRRNLGPVMALAVPGLVISTAIIGALVWLVTDIPLAAALLLGAILSATDPVAVIALFKQLGAPKRLIVLVEGESLFNDATSIVLAKILLGVIAAGTVSLATVGDGVVDFLVLFFGGLLVGVVLGWITGWLLGLVESDAMIEISLTTTLAYLSFLIAEEVLHVSGVMATVGAGLVLGGWGRVKISPPVRHYLEHFWEYLAFLANALIFLLVGMKADLSSLWGSLDLLLVVIVAMFIARAVLIYGMIPLMCREGAKRIGRGYQTVMFWGGLRGAIALAIVLGLEGFEYGQQFVAVVMGVVLFTLLVQGLSIGRVMRWFGLDRPPLLDRLALLEYRLNAKELALQRIPELEEGGQFSRRIAARLQRRVRGELLEAQRELGELRAREMDPDKERSLLYLRTLAEEKALYSDLFARGHISEAGYRHLLLGLSVQIDSIRFGDQLESLQGPGLRSRLERRLNAAFDRIPLLGGVSERMRLNRVALTYENAWAHYQSSRRVLQRLDRMVEQQAIPAEVVAEVRGSYEGWHRSARRRLDRTAEQYPEFVTAVQERLAQRMALHTEVEVAHRQAEQGNLAREMAEHLEEQIRDQLRALRGQEVAKLRVEPEELLRKVPFFGGVPREEFAGIAAQLNAHTYGEHDIVIRQGDPGDALFLIARGVVRVSREEEGRQHALGTLIAGDFFGEMALLHDEPRSATVQAVTPCSVYTLNRLALQQVMETYPEIRTSLEEADRQRKAAQQGHPSG